MLRNCYNTQRNCLLLPKNIGEDTLGRFQQQDHSTGTVFILARLYAYNSRKLLAEFIVNIDTFCVLLYLVRILHVNN